MNKILSSLIFSLGGLGIFFLGINNFSEALKKISSAKVKEFLSKVTSSPISGMLVGLIVTSIIQSSSATTVLTIGFVNAGLMNLIQAVGIVYGANIGTTVTAQIMAFKMEDIAPIFVFIGAIFYLFGKNNRLKYIGSFLVGLGLIFIGMYFMKLGIKPWRESKSFQEFFIKFSYYPLLGVLTGLIITIILQSSSVTVGMVITLVSQGLIDIKGAIPIIFGDNIGTCITAFIASLNANINAKKVAYAHIFFNVFGTIIFLNILNPYIKFITLTSSDPVRQAANSHTFFNVFNTIIFLPFTKYFVAFINYLFKGKKEEREKYTIFLDKNLLDNPEIAIESIKKEVIRAIHICKEAMEVAKDFLINGNTKRLYLMNENETVLDYMQYEISNYLVKLTTNELSKNEASIIPKIIHAVNDFERIGDHSQNLYNIFIRCVDNKIKLSERNRNDLSLMVDKIIEYINYLEITCSVDCNKLNLEKAYNFEKEINLLRDKYRNNYYEVLKSEKGDSITSTIYYDIIINLEKIGDHLTNIAEAFALKENFVNDDQI
ncbi:MAG: Na/Pi cotransporter family protein [Spirochaetes bacterium]|nr:Na/Pi cotransporter family protein [Spirochaetota bacterium]